MDSSTTLQDAPSQLQPASPDPKSLFPARQALSRQLAENALKLPDPGDALVEGFAADAAHICNWLYEGLVAPLRMPPTSATEIHAAAPLIGVYFQSSRVTQQAFKTVDKRRKRRESSEATGAGAVKPPELITSSNQSDTGSENAAIEPDPRAGDAPAGEET